MTYIEADDFCFVVPNIKRNKKKMRLDQMMFIWVSIARPVDTLNEGFIRKR